MASKQLMQKLQYSIFLGVFVDSLLCCHFRCTLLYYEMTNSPQKFPQVIKRSANQARNQLGTPGGERFSERSQNF